jgi:hypothetical protein
MSDASTSLFVMLRGVLFDESEQTAYRADPTGYLSAHGYDELDHDDVSEAMTLLADSLPADQAALLSSTGDATGFGGSAVAPAPPSDLAPVDQAVHTINHFVDTVREAPDAGLGGTDPGPGDLALLDDAGAVGLADDPSAAFDDLGVGFDDLVPGDVSGEADGLDAFDDLGSAPPAEALGDLDDQLAAFAAPDVLVHGDPVDALLEEGDLAVAFETGGAATDPGAFDPAAFESDGDAAPSAPAFTDELDGDPSGAADDAIGDLDDGA